MCGIGMVSKDFELSSQPNFGDWKISVESEVHLIHIELSYLLKKRASVQYTGLAPSLKNCSS